MLLNFKAIRVPLFFHLSLTVPGRQHSSFLTGRGSPALGESGPSPAFVRSSPS